MQRKHSQTGKGDLKDKASIDNLMPFLNSERFEEKRSKLTAKERKAADEFLNLRAGDS